MCKLTSTPQACERIAHCKWDSGCKDREVHAVRTRVDSGAAAIGSVGDFTERNYRKARRGPRIHGPSTYQAEKLGWRARSNARKAKRSIERER